MYFNGTLDPVTNQEDWSYVIEIDDADTDEPIDLTGAAMSLNVRDTQYRAVVISGSIADGTLSVIDTGVVQIRVPSTKMQTLVPTVYDVGLVISMNGSVQQLIVGRLPVQDGVGVNLP